MARPGWHSRGYLPHYDADGLVQHVVFRLADSLPKAARMQMDDLDRTERLARFDTMLDASLGDAVLKRPAVAQLVVNVLKSFEGERYTLHAWCIMPNHVHVVAEPKGNFELGTIVKSWKAFSAAQINRLLERSGRLWAADYFDRFMRDEAQLVAAIAYVEANPVAARLCENAADWAYSSAYRHGETTRV